MRLSSRFCTAVLAASIVVVGLEATVTEPAVAATTPAPVAVETYERPDVVSAQLAARLLNQRVEITDARTETVTTWANPDGTFTTDTTSGPIRVRKNGAWAPLDLSLELRGGRLHPKASPSDVSFSAGGNGPLTSQSSGGRSLDLGWKGALPKPEIDGGVATYRNVMPNTDLEVATTSNGFTEKLVLTAPPATAPVVRFPLTAHGLKVGKGTGGEIVGKDTAGRAVMQAPAPRMWGATKDAKSGEPKRSALIPTQVVDGVHGQELVLSPPLSFFTDPSLTYPVVVDPSVNLANAGDTWVQNDYTTSQYSDPWLKVGTYDAGAHIARSFIKWTTTPITGKHILSATLSLYEHWSYSCTAANMSVGPLAGAFSSSTVWSNQPGYTGTYGANSSFAKGYSSSCPDGRQSISVLGMTGAWAAGTITNYGMKLWASETDSTGWKKFCSGNVSGSGTDAPCTTSANVPTMSVTYNTSPNVPTTPSPATASYTNDTTPTYSAKVTDPDGGSLHGVYYVQDVSGPTWIANGGVGSTVSSGGTSTYTRTSALTNGHTYQWRVRGNDGTDSGGYQPSATTWNTFTVDTTAPNAPVTSSTAFPANVWTAPASGTFSWTESSTDVTGYYYGLDTPSPATWTTSKTSASLTPADGPHTFYVRSKDHAGNLSAVTAYAFSIGTGQLLSPADQDRTQASTQLSSAAPTTKTHVSYRYRIGSTGTFVALPTNDVTYPGTTNHPTWPVARDSGSGLFPDLTWNAAATVTTDSVVQVEACFHTSSSDVNPSCSPWNTLQIARHAFGDSFATENVGPGSVSLLTGDYSVNATDTSVPYFNGSLTVGRTLTTNGLASSGVFGPGWVASLPGPDTGVAQMTITDASGTTGYVTLTDDDGGQSVYLKTSAGTGYPMTFAGVGDAAADGTTLTKDSATQLTLAEDDASTTVWTWQTPSGGTAGWYVDHVSEPQSASTTTYSRDTAGRVTEILAPLPAGVASCTTMVDGCRKVTLAYAATTTATSTTFGDVAGQLASVSFQAFDPQLATMTTTQVAGYAYDSTGHLRQEWDPRLDVSGVHLAVAYTYDTAGRLATVTPPGLAAYTMAYDTTGRLASVSRPDPANGTATTTVSYGVPFTGSSAPVEVGAATAATWGQTGDLPVTATAVFGADHVPSGAPSSTDWPYAAITYLDVNGRAVDTASYGAGAWQVETTTYDKFGNVVQALSAANRAQALAPTEATDPFVAALSDSAARADLLQNDTTYTTDGVNATDTYGPMHPVTLDNGSVLSARAHNHYVYDEGKPDSTVYNLATTVTSTALGSDGVDYDARTTKNGYEAIVSGDATGWSLRAPTKVTTVMSPAADLVAITRYNAAGQAIESRLPAGAAGGDAHSTVSTFYTTAANATYPACGGKPGQAGLLCRTDPAAQPASGANLRSKTYTYTILNDLYDVVETVGSTTRTTSTRYDAAGRKTSESVTSTIGTAVPSSTYAYDTATGLLVSVTRSDGPVLTTEYDSLGRVTSSTDADDEETTTTYDIEGRPASVTDRLGATTYTYDGTDSLGRTEHRGLATALTLGGLGTGVPNQFTGAYDESGAMVSETYPTGLVATTTYDNNGTATDLSYDKDGDNWLRFSGDRSVAKQLRTATSPGGQQAYSYDLDGRLTNVTDLAADIASTVCTARAYTYDADSNRTRLDVFTDGTDTCPTTATGYTTHTYDAADRITDTGYVYDDLGRITTVPAADAGGADVTLTYYANDMVRSQAQSGRTMTWTLEPDGRLRGWTDSVGNLTSTNHYAGGGDSPSWIGVSDGSWSRNLPSLDGGLGVIQTSAGDVDLQITNLHGDTVATITDATTAVSPDAYFESTEFGAPRSTNPVTPRYGWLGSKQRSADDLAGIVLMGARLYLPSTGRFLQVDPVAGGSANAYDYVDQDPLNAFDLDGTMREATRSDCNSRCEANYTKWSNTHHQYDYHPPKPKKKHKKCHFGCWIRRIGDTAAVVAAVAAVAIVVVGTGGTAAPFLMTAFTIANGVSFGASAVSMVNSCRRRLRSRNCARDAISTGISWAGPWKGSKVGGKLAWVAFSEFGSMAAGHHGRHD
jgi:RHS repeat-associated protein